VVPTPAHFFCNTIVFCAFIIQTGDIRRKAQWREWVIALIDAIIGFALMPITIALMKFCFAHKTIIPRLAYSIVCTVFWMWLIVKYGATPGKMVIQARIINSNGEFLNWDKAFLRMVFPGLLMAINSYLRQWQVMNTAPTETSINSLLEIGRAMNQYGQPFTIFARILGVTACVDVLAVLFNKRKRAIHDFIAGSYVVTKDSLREYTENISSESRFDA
jgi:uncharacterized RDD family membrane protein YckC